MKQSQRITEKKPSPAPGNKRISLCENKHFSRIHLVPIYVNVFCFLLMKNGMQFHCKTIGKCKGCIKQKRKIYLLLHHLLNLFYDFYTCASIMMLKIKITFFPINITHTHSERLENTEQHHRKITPIISPFGDVNTPEDVPPDSVCVFVCILKCPI